MAKDFSMKTDPALAQTVAGGTSNIQTFLVPSFGLPGNLYNLAYVPDSTNTFGVISSEASGIYFMNFSGDTATGVYQSSSPIDDPNFQVILEPVQN